MPRPIKTKVVKPNQNWKVEHLSPIHEKPVDNTNIKINIFCMASILTILAYYASISKYWDEYLGEYNFRIKK